jgi:hypothetical protein
LLLSLTHRFEGEPYRVERLTEVTIDRPVDDELFASTPPSGVRVDDLLARTRRPPMIRGRLRFRLHLFRRALHRRIRSVARTHGLDRGSRCGQPARWMVRTTGWSWSRHSDDCREIV